MKLKTFFVPIYGFKVEVHDNTNVVMPNRRVKAATCIDRDNNVVVMGFNFDEPWGCEVVAHECLHAVNGILDARGAITDPNNDEPQCYLLEWFMEMLIPILDKHEGKTKVKDSSEDIKAELKAVLRDHDEPIRIHDVKPEEPKAEQAEPWPVEEAI